MSDAPPPSSPEDHVLGLLAGKWVAQAVSAAAQLGVSDALLERPLALEPLAERIGCDAASLERLLAVLVGEALYTLDDQARYALLPAGRALTGTGDGLRELAAFVGSPAQWAPWSALPDCVRHGRSAYESTHGEPLYAYLERHPEDARLYDEGIDRFTLDIARAVAERPELEQMTRVVDVGGGLGSLLGAVLERWPHLSGALVDIEHVVTRARARWGPRYEGRLELVAGDFFGSLPGGADLYVLKHVIHNWDDAHARRILRSCRAAMSEQAQLWLVEGVLHPGDGRSLQRMMDLEMMVLFGRGRARTKQELRELLASTGFRMSRTTYPLGRFARLIIARPAPAAG